MKVKHLIDKEEKLKHCGSGEWIDEPDSVEFEYEGFKCLISRIWKKGYPNTTRRFGGHLCGYVILTKDHPYFGKSSDLDLEVHGGITFGEGDEDTWMIGFDCAHSGDIVPTMDYMERNDPNLIEVRKIFPINEELKKFSMFNPIYRNIDFVIEECKKLAGQCKEASNGEA